MPVWPQAFWITWAIGSDGQWSPGAVMLVEQTRRNHPFFLIFIPGGKDLRFFNNLNLNAKNFRNFTARDGPEAQNHWPRPTPAGIA